VTGEGGSAEPSAPAGNAPGRGAASPLPAGAALDRFLSEADPARAMVRWLEVRGGARRPRTLRQLRDSVQREIAAIDAAVAGMLDGILHHPAFQRLEASWRGLDRLVDQVAGLGEAEARRIRIRVLNASWREIVRDSQKAIEFDQSMLFRKVYGEEFGTAGGEPYGVVLADFEVSHAVPDDVDCLRALAGVAAAAFCPFVFGGSPALLDVDSFRDLQLQLDLRQTFSQPSHAKWKTLRESDDARFVGITLPRVLARLPWTGAGGFVYREDCTAPGGRGYLWGTAVYAFGEVLVRAFANCGWLADIRGVQEGVLGGGVVTNLPIHSFATDRPGLASRGSTEVALTDAQERELGELGFIPLCRCKGTEFSVFYGNQSLHAPHEREGPAADNARLSAMLQYMFCASRFAHYVMVMGRDRLGSYATPSECQEQLQRWLLDYCTSIEGASLETKARYPLKSAQVQVREVPGRAGCYASTIQLQPHFQLDQVDASVRLVTMLTQARAS